MKFSSRVTLLVLSLWLALPIIRVTGEEPLLGPGAKLDSLTVGPTTYRQVQVRSVNARTVLFSHAGGMASIHLRELSPDWQARFHYDPAADAAAEEAAKIAPPAPVMPRPKPVANKGLSVFDVLLQRFGQPATVQSEVDLRPKFFQLELGVKNQGSRPSCAVFAVVSALEFQNAEVTGKPAKFSEEYLIWAVRKSVQRTPAPTPAADPAEDPVAGREIRDEGFSLEEVVAALRAYGIPLRATMPNTFGRKIEAIEDPPPAIIQEAREHQRIFAHQVPARDRVTLVNNIVHALNSGLPVAVGMAWPNYRALRSGYLSNQRPMADAGHAVTLVGYKSPTGRIEDAVFIFKNSWGTDWGQGGYGMVTYTYLSKNLYDAMLLEVQQG